MGTDMTRKDGRGRAYAMHGKSDNKIAAPDASENILLRGYRPSMIST